MATPLALVWDLIATDNASAVFKKVGTEAGIASKESEGIGKAFLAAGAIVGVAAIGMGVVAVKMALDMQESNAKIQGNAQITAQAATAIGDAFLGTAGKSTFSGKTMADAFGPIAGVIQSVQGHTLTAADAMGFMAASTTLAEAAGRPLSETSANLAAVMQNYGLKVKDAADASNILFNTSRLTNIPLDTLTATVDKLHGKLGIASPSLRDTSALMVDLANHGISGSKGVLVVNGALTSLLSGSKGSTAELKTLGVHVFDASGKFVGMKSVLEQLTPKLKDMSDKQRLAAESALFGSGAARAMNSTIMAGAGGLAAATAAVTKHGAAEYAAKAAAETLGGQMKTLKAAFADGVTILGEKLVPWVMKGVTWFQNLAKEFGNNTGAGGKLRTVLTDVWGAVQKVASYLTGTAIPAVRDFGKWILDNRTPITVIAGIIAAVFLPALVRMAVQATISGAETVAVWVLIQASAIASTVSTVAQFVVQGAQWVASGVVAVVNGLIHVGAWLAVAAGAVANTVLVVAQFVIQAAGWVATGVAAMAGAVVIAAAWLISMGPIVLVIAAVAALGIFIATHMELIKGWISAAWDWIKDKTSAAWDWIKDTTSSVWGAIVGFFEGIPGKVSAAIQPVIDFVKTVFSYSPIGIVTQHFGDIVSFISGIPGKILSALGDLGGLLLGAGKAIMDGLFGGIQAGFDKVKGVVGGIASWIKDHKGPIEYDRQLLVPHGGAIMAGLNDGLTTGFGKVQGNVGSMAGRLSIGSLDFASSAVRSNAVSGSMGATSADIHALGEIIRALPKSYQMGQRQGLR